MKNHEDASAIFARLQSAHDDQLIDSHELSILLRTTRNRVHQMRHSTPEKLPAPLMLFDRRLVWRLGAVRQWIRSLPVSGAPSADDEIAKQVSSVTDDAEMVKGRVGRPRKQSGPGGRLDLERGDVSMKVS